MRSRFLALTASVAATALLAGCSDTGGTNAGLTNGPPPSAADKSAVRTDLPASTGTGRGTGVVESESRNTSTDTGTSRPEQPGPDSANPDAVRANPPAKDTGPDGSAAGATRPPDEINTGTSRSPH